MNRILRTVMIISLACTSYATLRCKTPPDSGFSLATNIHAEPSEPEQPGYLATLTRLFTRTSQNQIAPTPQQNHDCAGYTRNLLAGRPTESRRQVLTMGYSFCEICRSHLAQQNLNALLEQLRHIKQ